MSNRVTVSDNIKELFADGGEVYESPLLGEEEDILAQAELGEEELEATEDELEMQIQEAIAFLTEQGYEVVPA